MNKGRRLAGWIALCLLLKFMAPAPAMALVEAPHNRDNNISCGNCHGAGITNSPFWGGSGDEVYNNFCFSVCHKTYTGRFNETAAPFVKTHSSATTNSSRATWGFQCITCHYPHSHQQNNWDARQSRGGDLYLASGTLGTPGVYDGVEGTTTFPILSITYKNANWQDADPAPHPLKQKTSLYRGAILVPNQYYSQYNYAIYDMASDASTVTLRGNLTNAVWVPMLASYPFKIIYGQFVRRLIDKNKTPGNFSDDLPVRFYDQAGSGSFADGDATYDGICEVCHTDTSHFRSDGSGPDQEHGNVGGAVGTNCIACHPHSNGFAHGAALGSSCDECHGHDPGYGGATGGKGSFASHSTHTENDADDLKGPNIVCGDCHNTSNFPYFKSGTVITDDGRFDLAETDVCDTCHSPGGSYDGVNDASVGAKANWDGGVYSGDALQSGKEKWCATCHDEAASQISGVNAPNIIGDEDGSYIYGTGWGYYKTGHGLAAGEAYPYKGGLIEPPLVGGAGRSVECNSCHDFSTVHIDGNARTFNDGGSGTTDASVYRIGYRLKQVSLAQGAGASTKEPLLVPWPNGTANSADNYRLCANCHDPDPFLNAGNMNTNLVTAGINRHQAHLVMTPRWPSDWSGGNNSNMTCVTCHNVHGSKYLAMVRDGSLTGRSPGLQIWYKNASSTWSGSNPPNPENLPLAASNGNAWIGNSSSNLCSHCHASTSTSGTDRAPFQNVAQAPVLSWTGEAGYTSDGSNPDSAQGGTDFEFRVTYTDANNEAPSPIKVWIDLDDNDSYGGGEDFVMTEADGSDTNYTDGKIFKRNVTINQAGDGVLKYKFEASDGINPATGAPISDGSIVLFAPPAANTSPELTWATHATCGFQGVDPLAEVDGTDFVFTVVYTDADNTAPASIQVWVDTNDNGNYNDAGEKQVMNLAGGGDGDYTNGETFTYTWTLNAIGVHNYRFAASDGTDAATGEPTVDRSVSVVNSTLPPLTVCASGCDYTDIQSAIGSTNNKTILVDTGSYGAINLTSRSNVLIRSVCGPDFTTVSGGTNQVFFQNSGSNTVDGFFLSGGTNGVAHNSTNGTTSIRNSKIDSGTYGVSFTANSGNIVIENSEIYGNSTGIYFVSRSGHQVTKTVIRNNSRGIFLQNTSATFTGCMIKNNSPSSGLGINGAVTANFYQSTFLSNSAAPGGAISNGSSTFNLTMENCIIAKNQATSGNGGAFYFAGGSASFTNCTFADNAALSGSGGLAFIQNTTFTMNDVIIWNNSASGTGQIVQSNAGGSLTITDAVMSNDGDANFTNSPYFNGSLTPTVNGYTSENDPNFVDTAGDNYHLQFPSDAIDNGSTALTLDVDGDSRPLGAGDDIGADETLPTAAGSNNAPVLDWTGEANFVSDGIHPDTDGSGSSFEFRVEYSDADNDAPALIQLWIDEDNNGAFGASEKYTMTVDGGGADYIAGKFYTKTLTLTCAGGCSRNYRFYASDGTDEATGSPMLDSSVALVNNIPTLAWTGEANYTGIDPDSGGVHPDSGEGGSSFTFRVDYTDGDNTAPATIQVWVDKDDSSTYETIEKFDLSITGGNGDYTDGERYTVTLPLVYLGDGSLSYRFYATDGTDQATGTPISGQTVTVTVPAVNNAPSLAWVSESCRIDGVIPATGLESGDFEFKVKYTDADNECPASDSSDIQVWIDENDNGSYEGGEKFNLVEDGVDGDCTDGKLYKLTRQPLYAGDGIMNYRFFATDGKEAATGVPVTSSTVEVVSTASARGVRTGGDTGPIWYSQISAVPFVDNLTVLVYPGSYDPIDLTSRSGVTVQSVCGVDLTTITGSGNLVFFQNSGSNTIDGFTLSGGTNGVAHNGTNGTTTIKNSKIENSGNAVSFTATSGIIVIENSEIYNNTIGINFTSRSGHQVNNTVIRNNGRGIFLQNTSASFTGCTIKNNSPNSGLGINGAVTANFYQSIFLSNTGAPGGAVNNGSASFSLTMENSIIAKNQATSGNGGAMYFAGGSASFTNCTFAENAALSGNGGLAFIQNTNITMHDAIVWNNMASGTGQIAQTNAGGSITITDTVMTNSGGGAFNDGPEFAGSWLPTVNGYTSGNDPNFVNAAGGNYHLQLPSDAIDSGSTALTIDIDGDSRPLGGGDDIGADEYVP